MKLPIRIFGTVALMLAFVTAAPAFESTGEGEGPLCGKIVPVDGKKTLLGATECKCSGGVTLEISGLSYKASGDDALVCESYTWMPPYDAYDDGGDTLIEQHKFVNEEKTIGTCDNSDCWDWFLVWGGSPICKFDTTPTTGGHMSYVAVGTCEKTPQA